MKCLTVMLRKVSERENRIFVFVLQLQCNHPLSPNLQIVSSLVAQFTDELVLYPCVAKVFGSYYWIEPLQASFSQQERCLLDLVWTPSNRTQAALISANAI